MNLGARAWKIALGILVSGLMLCVVLWRVEWAAARDRLFALRLDWLAVSFGVSLLVLVCRGFRFRALTERSPWAEVTAAVAVQNALTRVTPLRLGELSLPIVLARRCGEPIAESLIALVWVRLVELWLITAIGLGAALIYFAGGAGEETHWLWLAVGLLTATLLVLRQILAVGVTVGLRLAERLRLNRWASIARGLDSLREAVKEERRFSTRARWALGPGSLIIVVIQFLLYYCLVRGCGLDLDPLVVIIGATAAQIAGALPLSTVGTVGPHETAWTAGFVWLGVSLTDAAITGVLTQIITLAYAGLFALPAAIYLSVSRPPR